jgi:hypothetical protein
MRHRLADKSRALEMTILDPILAGRSLIITPQRFNDLLIAARNISPILKLQIEQISDFVL